MGRIVWAIVAGVWLYKAGELLAHGYGLLPGNLGWGNWVSLDLPVAVTAAAVVLMLVRKLARLARRLTH